MNYRETPATGHAAQFAEFYWTLACGPADPPQRVVPDGQTELIVHLADPFERFQDGRWQSQPRIFLAGQITGPLLLRPAGKARILGIRLHPQGAARLLAAPMSTSAGRMVEPADLAPQLDRLLQRAANLATFDAQAAFLDRALAEYDRLHGCADLLVDETVRRIAAAPVPPDLASLARDVGIGLRQLERRFLDGVGLRPKQFARMRRFQRVLRAVDGGSVDWAGAAARFGYYDQAHLIRDCREFSGETPAALLRGNELARHFL